MRRLTALALLATMGAGLATAGAAPRSSDLTARGGPSLRLERIATLETPTYVDAAPGRPQLLFVTELAGSVRILRERTLLEQPFLDISPRVSSGGERGLLSMAFDPGYRKNRIFYVAYVNRSNDVQVDRFRTSANHPGRALPGTRRKVIEIQHPRELFHYGGQLEFGPDGYLYLSTGDGWPGDGLNKAQDPTSALGKILRIDPRRRGGYDPAQGNPFIGTGRDEVFALGLRNPARFSFDGHDLWIADPGQDSWEEINRVALGQAGGANFGWSLYEGNHPYKAGAFDPLPPAYEPPIYEYANAGDYCAVIGGYVVRDPALPSLQGRYLFTDFCDGALRSLAPGDAFAAARETPLGLRVPVPTSFGEGVRGRIYVASLDGGVFQLVQTGT
ncbi:MAG TPA: PQQ-dependent sugar dehydrogenase [Solirubrobacterales bacterium]|nr:PQQ-dependent sugar dehydrogenase [Solirubrobacterales bacterium]